MEYLIKGVQLVNEEKMFFSDVYIKNERIEKIAANINLGNKKVKEINAENLYLIPGMIDDQVHFREPGLTHKATINSESKAAIAGGITSFMDMPNTIPNVLKLEDLEYKYELAAQNSLANFSFFMGINQHNLDQALKIDNENVCGLTDDGLYFNNDKGIMANYPEFLDELFSKTNSLVALHCEDDLIIHQNTLKAKNTFGDHIPFSQHAIIRSEQACFDATKRVIDLAKKHHSRLHIFHVSTFKETTLFDQNIKLSEKRITGEACVHHLFFDDNDYEKLGSKIKWNPSIKTKHDKNGLLNALIENKLDIIATDHAPHTINEKSGNYFSALSGGPLVQHALPALLELYHQNKISLEKLVQKTSHHVAEIYKIKERGYLREGYFADCVLINLNSSWEVNKNNILYKCAWSPLEGYQFKSSIDKTFVNGNLVYDQGKFYENIKGKRLKFSKIR